MSSYELPSQYSEGHDESIHIKRMTLGKPKRTPFLQGSKNGRQKQHLSLNRKQEQKKEAAREDCDFEARSRGLAQRLNKGWITRQCSLLLSTLPQVTG